MKKVYWSADKGIDISGYSKNLIPELFLKIFSAGYSFANLIQVTKEGLEVTLYYQEPHEYVKYHVLDIKGSNTPLDGEHRVIAVTENTVTIRLKEELLELPTNPEDIVTHVAPLGWELVYDQLPIRIHKFKALDGSDLFMRLVFRPDDHSNRPVVNMCVGRTWDPETGFITDEESMATTKELNVGSTTYPHLSMCQSKRTTTSEYTQRYSQFTVVGLRVNISFVGDIYGYLMNVPLIGESSTSDYCVNQGIFPFYNPFNLPHPLSLVTNYNYTSTEGSRLRAYRSSDYEVLFAPFSGSSSSDRHPFTEGHITIRSLYLPKDIDPFNGVSAVTIPVCETNNGQSLGIIRDIYRLLYTSSSGWPLINGKADAVIQENDIANQSPVWLGHQYPYCMLTIPIDD